MKIRGRNSSGLWRIPPDFFEPFLKVFLKFCLINSEDNFADTNNTDF